MENNQKTKKPVIRKMEDSDVSVETTPFYIIRSRVIIDPPKKIKNPTYFLTHQLKKPLNLDAVKLVKEIRQNLWFI